MTGTASRKRFTWGFGTALLGIAAVVLWTELAMTAVRAFQAETEPSRWLFLLALLGLTLPLAFLVVFRWELVYGFFRSIRVGVLNLALIGLASILGVLFHQEDPNRPIPPEVEGRTVFQSGRYDHYLAFRHAQAYFAYHLLHGRGLHLLPGVPRECQVDEGAIQGQLDRLASWTPTLNDRYGEDYALGLEVSTAKALHAQAENAEVDALEKAWDDALWTTFVVADSLDLLRVYKSDWFAALWAILFLGVVASAARKGIRGMLRFRAWGFTLSHVGVMLVVLGGFYGRLTEERGMVHLRIGEAEGSFGLYQGGRSEFQRPSPLPGILPEGQPFLVRLADFRADNHDILEAIYMREGEDGRLESEFPLAPPKERVFEGKVVELDRGVTASGRKEPQLRLEVLEYEPQAMVRPAILPAPDTIEEATAAVELSLRSPSGEEETLLLRAGSENSRLHPESGTRLRLRVADGLEDAAQLLSAGTRERHGVLRRASADGKTAWTGDVLPGASWRLEAGGVEYVVRVLEATPDLRLQRGPDGRWQNSNREVPAGQLESRNPAVLLYVEGPGGQSEERWVMANHFHGGGRTFPDLVLEFDWDEWAAPAAAHRELFLLPDGQVAAAGAGDAESLALLAGDQAMDLAAGWRAVPRRALMRAVEGQVLEPVADASFYDSTPGAIRLRATTPAGSEEVVLSAAGQGDYKLLHYPVATGTERIVLVRFREDRDDMPLEWRSRLEMLRPSPDGRAEAEVVGRGEIRVNDYYTFEGFRFFQTNADPKDPAYSGIGVVYDPGIEAVILGMWMIMAGAVVAFIVKPIVLRRFS